MSLALVLGAGPQAVWVARPVARLSKSSPIVFVCPMGTVWCGVGFGSMGFGGKGREFAHNCDRSGKTKGSVLLRSGRQIQGYESGSPRYAATHQGSKATEFHQAINRHLEQTRIRNALFLKPFLGNFHVLRIDLDAYRAAVVLRCDDASSSATAHRIQN